MPGQAPSPLTHRRCRVPRATRLPLWKKDGGRDGSEAHLGAHSPSVPSAAIPGPGGQAATQDPPSLLAGQWVLVAPERGESVSPAEEHMDALCLVPVQSETHLRTLGSRTSSNSWQPLGRRSRNMAPGG